mmetsp:Transcript_27030/g.61073  ORF Transcript_27030/g.61073 Transcript_27030/m.61073 type:complete len:472 (-) Transcript_27030:3065-4480(-)
MVPSARFQIIRGVCAGHLFQSCRNLNNVGRRQWLVCTCKSQLVRRHRRSVTLRLLPGEAHALRLHFRAFNLGHIIGRSRVSSHRLTCCGVLSISNFIPCIHLRVIRVPRQQAINIKGRIIWWQILLQPVLLHLRIVRKFQIEPLNRRSISVGSCPSNLQRVRSLLSHVRRLRIVRRLRLQCRDPLRRIGPFTTANFISGAHLEKICDSSRKVHHRSRSPCPHHLRGLQRIRHVAVVRIAHNILQDRRTVVDGRLPLDGHEGGPDRGHHWWETLVGDVRFRHCLPILVKSGCRVLGEPPHPDQIPGRYAVEIGHPRPELPQGVRLTLNTLDRGGRRRVELRPLGPLEGVVGDGLPIVGRRIPFEGKQEGCALSDLRRHDIGGHGGFRAPHGGNLAPLTLPHLVDGRHLKAVLRSRLQPPRRVRAPLRLACVRVDPHVLELRSILHALVRAQQCACGGVSHHELPDLGPVGTR